MAALGPSVETGGAAPRMAALGPRSHGRCPTRSGRDAELERQDWLGHDRAAPGRSVLQAGAAF